VSIVFGLSYLFGQGVLVWIRDAEKTFTIAIVLVSIIAAVYLYWNRKSFLKAIFGDPPRSDS
jgi:membrane protein DedA with SNARE-associated domain